MKIQFIGAAHEVTGSCTLLEVGGRYYLVDCGMEQGADIFENAPLPVNPAAIEAVFLTHAHIDHSGMLPKLCKDGFTGAIYATEATCPDHCCMKRGFCASGTDIVCLPNRLVIHFLGAQTVDAAVG